MERGQIAAGIGIRQRVRARRAAEVGVDVGAVGGVSQPKGVGRTVDHDRARRVALRRRAGLGDHEDRHRRGRAGDRRREIVDVRHAK